MSELTAEQIAQRAFDLDLLDDRQLRDIWGQFGSRNVDTEEFKQHLLRREILTNFQMERLLRGERTGYFYGEYKVLYLVGKGSFARVFRAVHRETGQVMAVKVLRQSIASDPQNGEKMRDQFIQEGEMGRTLRHPNIVSIFEVGEDRKTCYLVMEFVEGRNLREFIKTRKKFDASEATRLAVDIARALDYAHKRGVLHRDMKASNVLVSSVGRAKLVDFGLANLDPEMSADDEETLEKIENARTIDYTALERATGVKRDDTRSDVYFLGCIYYHMLAGLPPLEESRDRIQRLSKTRFTAVKRIETLLPELPKSVSTVVTKSMELDPKFRYQTPGEMLLDLMMLQQRLAGEGETGGEAAAVVATTRQRSIMIVEGTPSMQDTFREHFKKNGFRVLVTSDPQRPLNTFNNQQQEKPADCVLFSLSDGGAKALEAFNQFCEDRRAATVPAILLVSARHSDWLTKAKTGPCHVTVPTPVKLKELRKLLDKLVPLDVADSHSDQPEQGADPQGAMIS